jgi:hypothetical protein
METTGWPGLTPHDAFWCVKRLPKCVFDLLQKQPGKVTVAGGYIRSCIAQEPVNDIDLLTPSKAEAETYAKAIAEDSRLHESDNAYTVIRPRGPVIQFIHRWTFERPEAVVPSFDFTIARAALWFDGGDKKRWRTLCDPRFYADLAAKRLVYCSPVREEEAGGSLLRVLKFYQRGYRIPLDSLGAVMARMAMACRFESIPPEELRGDGELRWAKVLTGLLREVDPNTDPDRMSHLPGDAEITDTLSVT